MYQFAYPAVADELPLQSPLSHLQTLNLAIEFIEMVDNASCGRDERSGALSEVRRLWASIPQPSAISPASQGNVSRAAREIIEEIDALRADLFFERSQSEKRG